MLEPGNVYGSLCPQLPNGGDRERAYDMEAKAEFGVWKFRGNQRPVEAEVSCLLGPGGSNVQGIDAALDIEVYDEFGNHVGIAPVAVSGPQLQSINGNGEAECDASGTEWLQGWGSVGFGNGSAWGLEVHLAVTGAYSPGCGGSPSRLPIFEGSPGTPDTYILNVVWNDGAISPPIPVVLRGALHPDIDPAGTLAASDLQCNLSGLSAPGVLDLTINPGLIPSSSLASQFRISLDQHGTGVYQEFGGLQIPADGQPHMISLCVPGLQAGQNVDIQLQSVDVYQTS